jgi:deoxyribodipyrimidine photo-lyase
MNFQLNDTRISFIYETLSAINSELQKKESLIYILKGDPETIWRELIVSFDIDAVYINKDYEPIAIQRDTIVEEILVDYVRVYHNNYI